MYINFSAGYADLEMELIIEDSDKLINFIEELSCQFTGTFRRYTFFRIKKFYNIKSLPELTEKDFKKT